MVKGKALTYVLMAAVAAVWGIIFYRIYAGLGEDEQSMPVAVTKKVPYFKMVDHHTDQVHLEMGYRDPFTPAGKAEPLERKIGGEATQEIANSRPAKPIVQKPQVNWANIQYTGYINNATSTQKTVILAVNGNNVLLSEGQTAGGLKLLKYYGDSVRVNYQGETKNIKIK